MTWMPRLRLQLIPLLSLCRLPISISTSFKARQTARFAMLISSWFRFARRTLRIWRELNRSCLLLSQDSRHSLRKCSRRFRSRPRMASQRPPTLKRRTRIKLISAKDGRSPFPRVICKSPLSPLSSSNSTASPCNLRASRSLVLKVR